MLIVKQDSFVQSTESNMKCRKPKDLATIILSPSTHPLKICSCGKVCHVAVDQNESQPIRYRYIYWCDKY